jgi:uncharacterized protein involved in exopolysaccharide biosynthesis
MNELNQNLRMFRPLWRGLPIVALCCALALAVSYQYLRYATPLYESSAEIKLAEVNEGPINTNLIKTSDVFSPYNKAGAEVELLKSQLLVRKALRSLPFAISTYRVGEIRKTEMYTESPFLVTITQQNGQWNDEVFKLKIVNNGLLLLTIPTGETVRGQLGQPLHVPGAVLTIARNEALLRARPGFALADQYEFVRHSPAKLLSDVFDRLDVTSVEKDVAVIRVSYRSPVPEKAADLVNALTSVYMADYLENKYKAVNASVDVIDKQLQAVSASLGHAEDSVQGYRDQKRIVNIGQETETDLHKVAELKMQRANLHMSLAAANDLYRDMQSGKKDILQLAPTFGAINDELSNDIVKKIKDLQADRRDLLLRFRPQDEKIVAIDGKLADLNSYLLESIKNTRNTLTIKYNELGRAIGQAEHGFVGLPTREKNLAILQRDFQLNERLYILLHEKKTEAEIAKAAPTSSHRIISQGSAAGEPIAPNHALVLAVAGFLGLFGGMLLVYLFSGLRGTPGDAYAVQKESSLPLAASLPHLATPGQQLAFFRQLAIRLELKGLLTVGSKVVVSSFTGAEGQTFFFEHLRVALAAQAKKVRAIHIENAESLNPDALATELLLVHNVPLAADSQSLAVMAGAAVNLVLIDSRTTPLNRLRELEQLVAEYQLPNVQLCLNRAGYRPGLLARLWKRPARQNAWGAATENAHAGAPAAA